MFRNKRNYQVVIFNVLLISPSLHILTNVWFTINENCYLEDSFVPCSWPLEYIHVFLHTRTFLKEDISVQNQQISETEATCNCVDHAHKSLACETAATFPPWSLRENQIKTHTLKATSAAHPKWKRSSRGCVILYRKILNVTQERELKLMHV